jgi:NHLM bacteriocin system ABC transporter peptidase/ATP-binding protein
MEAVECGAASLAMILAYFGKHITLEETRSACGVSRDGSKASNLCKAGRSYGLEVKAYRKEPTELKGMPVPMIIHWNFNHFIVLEGFKKEKVYLRDPSSGATVVSIEEFDQSFTGVVLTFAPGDGFEKSGNPLNIWMALIKRMKGSELAILFIVLTGIALVIPGLVIPVFSRVFLDEILLGGNEDWMLPLLIGMCITAILRGILTWIREYCLLRMQTKIAISSSSKFLWHVLRMPMEFFSQRFAGDISSRMSSNNTVAAAIAGQLTSTVLSVLMLVFYFLLMLQYNVVLTLLAVISALLQMLYLQKIAKNRKDKNKKLLQDQGKMIGTAMSGLQTIESLKATGSEGDFFTMWSGYHAKVINGMQEMGVSSTYLTAVPTLISSLTSTAVLVLGGYTIMNGSMTIGLLVAFQSLMASFLEPVYGLLNLGSTIQNLEGDINRLEDVQKYPEDKLLENENLEIKDSEILKKLEGYIEIKELSFGYSIMEEPMIKDFSLSLKPGSRVALVGGSGSGKSTIAKIVAGILAPWSGEILFDGKSRRDIPRQILSSSIALVDQDICMVSGTIKDNLTLWDNSITEPEIIRAAKDSLIHDDITNRSGGYDNHMVEGGRNLSGGQRQRLEIARALLYNPSILIMDEATSALDASTEQLLDANIRKRGCTCIIVAHRLSTIRDCDEIIVLDRGKIAQRGTHEELILQKGYYADLINA